MWLSPKAQKSQFAKSLSKIDKSNNFHTAVTFFLLNWIGQGWKNVPGHNWSLLGGLGQFCWECLHCALLADVSSSCPSCRLSWSWINAFSTAQCAQPTGCWASRGSGLVTRAVHPAPARGQAPWCGWAGLRCHLPAAALATPALLLGCRSCRQQLTPGSGTSQEGEAIYSHNQCWDALNPEWDGHIIISSGSQPFSICVLWNWAKLRLSAHLMFNLVGSPLGEHKYTLVSVLSGSSLWDLWVLDSSTWLNKPVILFSDSVNLSYRETSPLRSLPECNNSQLDNSASTPHWFCSHRNDNYTAALSKRQHSAC